MSCGPAPNPMLSALWPASAPRRNGGKLPEPYRIDVHHHVATQNNPLYDVPDGMSWWSVDNALRVMDGNQIRVAMLSPSGHLPQQYGLVRLMTSLRDGPAGHSRPVRALIRRAVRTANQEVAQIASARPDRFGFFASLMLPHPGDAADEAKYALDELGADGCFLPTNFGSLYLGDGVFEPQLVGRKQPSAPKIGRAHV